MISFGLYIRHLHERGGVHILYLLLTGGLGEFEGAKGLKFSVFNLYKKWV